MEVLEDKIGTITKNNVKDIGIALGVDDVKHIGDFVFCGRLWGAKVIIKTEPTDEAETEVKVTGIRIDEVDLQRKGIYKNKVGFYYWMEKGSETAESYIALPVSPKRYEQLFSNLSDTNSKVYDEVRSALKNLAKLQGYRLTNFKPEFTFTQEEDED